jgi:glycosyltransferase involved in cell wall biosynthesis
MLPQQPDALGAVNGSPVVSIIVPARNEEACLAACLQSLVQQDGVTREILVVDDDSTDRTAAIGKSFPGVRVLSTRPLAPGWYGKANACQTGADAARGRWLLFTDADTMHKPGSLARAVAEAERHGAVLLSYSPEQEVHGLAQRTLMPLIFAELACTYRPQEVSDPSSPQAAANGQYLLLTREAYEAVGGHAAVAGDLLEDVALATLVKRSGRKLQFRFGGDAVRTRMYRSNTQMREGWTKNLVLLFPSARKLAWRRSLEFAGSVGVFSVAVISAGLGSYKLALVSAAVAAPT